MKILFLCVANSARSQVAEGLAKSMFRSDVEIHSAGSEPSGIVRPFAVEVMREAGVDISRHYSKHYDTLPVGFLADLDYVITLCAEEICPNLVTRAEKLSWATPDPVGVGSNDKERLDAFRSARDRIRGKLTSFGREHGILK